METRRLDYIKLFLVLIASLLISCGSNDDSVEYEKVKTVVKGNVYDVQRNITISNFEIKLVRFSSCGSLGGSGLCSENVATVFTDEFGNYEIEFDYIKDGVNYGFEQVYYGIPYHITYNQEAEPIVPGATNIIDVDAWRPVKLKLNLQIRNNNYPPLRVDNTIVETGYFSFPQASIFENIKDTIVYLDSKPNSSVELNFHYTSGYTNNDYHSKTEIVQTTLQDTISFTYLIDCSTFLNSIQ